MRLFLLTFLALLLVAAPAMAYVGPGAGLGGIGALLGMIGAAILGFLGILWYPIKRMIKKSRGSQPLDGEGADQ